jgi:hypothetical protein
MLKTRASSLSPGIFLGGADSHLETWPLNNLRAGIFCDRKPRDCLGTDRACAALKTKAILADEMVVINGLQIIGMSYHRRIFERHCRGLSKLSALPQECRRTPLPQSDQVSR